jgi:dTDP-4-dehydrorhamnose 3,5-epimerase
MNSEDPGLIFVETPIGGAFVVDLEPLSDERGFFARTWCQREFEAHGLETRLVQCSVSFNQQAGTLRGLHYQAAPYAEVKLVRCISGAVFDVIVDLRSGSPTFARHYSVILSAVNRRLLYIPEGCAHGFQTLEQDTEVAYQMSEFHRPDYSRGVRWNDPAFGIAWPPTETRIVNQRDQTYPDFQHPVLGRNR